MTFHEYVTKWFHEIVEDHKDDKEWCEDLFSQLGYDKIEHLDEDETCYDFLMAMSDENEIYESIFGFDSKVKCLDDLSDTESFLTTMFKTIGDDLIKQYDFAKELFEDMASNCLNYTNPIGFFEDLSRGGCSSGMIGMFIYHDSCKQFYINHIDSLEDFKEDLEDELGEPIKNTQGQPHYTFVDWLCYEELAFKIARELWEDEF